MAERRPYIRMRRASAAQSLPPGIGHHYISWSAETDKYPQHNLADSALLSHLISYTAQAAQGERFVHQKRTCHTTSARVERLKSRQDYERCIIILGNTGIYTHPREVLVV
ncbi:hypothetical protein CERZMDRAFT_91214 [Cercospora zeae-maydis SCOH1-5]|uniref:Uncharacterized protein n=1 Tax=Cercospora zeae-maydis SCOH1-5 TaxID=717836 RepID=A0A6A6F9F1_9PEZI|nr:hypothetical protein CERZMDRAFT_91214 [Cercospora zeae-maydis SCOH1-5]